MSEKEELLRLLLGLGSVNEDYHKYDGKILRAPFGWPGGKTKSYKEIIPRLPERSFFADVFGGSGIIMLTRKPSPLDVFNDRNAGIVALYRVLRDPEKLEELIEKIELSIHAREEWTWCKESWENCEDDVERAYRWYYMTSCSFAQVGRNFGLHTSPPSMSPRFKNRIQYLEGIHQRFRTVQVENMDFRSLLTRYALCPDRTFYLDPPYLDAHSHAYRNEMTEQDHVDMLNMIHELPGFFAVSGYDSDLYNSYSWDDKHTWKSYVSAQATDNGGATYTRGHATECLWIIDNE